MMAGFSTSAVALTVACILLVTPAAVTPQEALSSPGAATLLGGPCAADSDVGAFPRLRDAQRAAESNADRGAVIELQKRIVRHQCGNAWRWARLAELYLQDARADEAIAVLTYVDSIAPNQLEEIRNLSESMLRAAWESEAFRGSVLERRMEGRVAAHLDRLTAFRARLASLDHRPPEEWIAVGACPFECCAYRTWQVNASTPLHERARGDSVLGILPAGSEVEALTGVVYVAPVPILVLHRTSFLPLGRPDRERLEVVDLVPGDVVFLLDYLGEGVSRLWIDGEVVEAETEPGVRAYCPVPDSECWGEYFYPDAALGQTAAWWVEVRTGDGLVGWTDRPENFGNKDACG